MEEKMVKVGDLSHMSIDEINSMFESVRDFVLSIMAPFIDEYQKAVRSLHEYFSTPEIEQAFRSFSAAMAEVKRLQQRRSYIRYKHHPARKCL